MKLIYGSDQPPAFRTGGICRLQDLFFGSIPPPPYAFIIRNAKTVFMVWFEIVPELFSFVT